MFHASALLGSPPANPVVAVCYAEEDIRVNDAVFITQTKPPRGVSKYVSRVSNAAPELLGSETFLGFSMSNVNGSKGGSEQLSVGVSGTFTTHADPAHIRRLQPGDYLKVGPPAPAQFLDHAETFHPPTYTTELDPVEYAPLRFVRQETASTMRVIITKGHLQVPGIFSNKGTSSELFERLDPKGHTRPRLGPDHDPVLNDASFPDGRFFPAKASIGVTTLTPDSRKVWVTSQHVWRVFMKMRFWLRADMQPGPGFVDGEGKRTGVFTMTSEVLANRMGRLVPFVLMVDAQNTVRLVDANSIASGRPLLLAEQLVGKAFTLSADTARDASGAFVHPRSNYPDRKGNPMYTKERTWIMARWEDDGKDLNRIAVKFWDSLDKFIPPGESETDGARWNRTVPSADTFRPSLQTLPDAQGGPGSTPIVIFAKALQKKLGEMRKAYKNMLPPPAEKFLSAMETWIGGNMPNGNSWAGVTDPENLHLVYTGISFSNALSRDVFDDGEGMDKATPELQQTLVGRQTTTDYAINTSKPRQANLDCAPKFARVWGLGAAWTEDDPTPENVLRGIPLQDDEKTLARWTVDPLYFASRHTHALPVCTQWVDRLALQEYAQLHTVLGSRADNYRSGVTDEIHPRLGESGKAGWTASAAMDAAPAEADFDALVD
jgi:hypothetical protein